MGYPPVPKLMQWQYGLSQTYATEQSILVVGGCSFTAWTTQLDCAASWPGYVLDRCRFDHCIDYSCPGSGNKFIGDSILYHFSQVPDSDIDKYTVLVMWTGIDREDQVISSTTINPRLGNLAYVRTDDKQPLNDATRCQRAQDSVDKIFEVYEYLQKRKIKFAFTYYINLLNPPYLPKRDTTTAFEGYIDSAQLKRLRALPWIPSKKEDFFYEYAFYNDDFSEPDSDQFHPTTKCHLAWTDQVLLPEMEKQLLVKKI